MKDVSVAKSKFRVGFKGVVNTSDESVTDMAYAVKAHNFAFDDDVLTGSIGIDRAQGYYPSPLVARHDYPTPPTNSKIKNVFLYRRLTSEGKHDDRIVAHLENGHFIYTPIYRTADWHEIEALNIGGEVSAVNYNFRGDDVLLLSSDEDALYIVNDAHPLVCGSAPKFTSLTVHNERVFGSVNGSQNQVWFSDDFNPVNWSVSSDEAGYINFSDECGEVIKVVSFLNYLYIFREYGIFRLTAYGEQSEFMLKKVFTDTGRIVKHSIELCGDKIVFYADEGLFAFDGYEVTRIAKELMPLNRTHLAYGAYLEDCYYLACDILEDEGHNNAVVRYRFSDKSISVLYGYDVRVLKSVRVHNGSQVLCVFSSGGALGMMSESGKVMGVPTLKEYASPCNTLSSPSVKTVRKVSFQTDSPVTLRVRTDDKVYERKVGGSEFMQTVHVEKSGRKIGFELSCDCEHARISPLVVDIDVMQI